MISARMETAISAGLARADIKADRAMNARNRGIVHTKPGQPLDPLGMALPAAERADIETLRRKRLPSKAGRRGTDHARPRPAP